jgi:hypothetical protein
MGRADGGDDREAFAQTYYGEGLVAYRSGALKYVFKPSRVPAPRPASDPPFPDAGREWLFDLATDPRESTSVADDRPDVLGRMRDRVQAWLGDQERRGRGRAAAQPRADGAPVRILGDPLERQLRALGCLE